MPAVCRLPPPPRCLVNRFDNTMTEDIARRWLDEAAQTANAHDTDAHMDLISKRVSLHGERELEAITWDDWKKQVSHEFGEGLLKRVSYAGLKMIASTGNGVMFKTFETVEASDGTVRAQGLEVLLALEEDGKWRLVQERIMPEEETAADGLLPSRH